MGEARLRDETTKGRKSRAGYKQGPAREAMPMERRAGDEEAAWPGSEGSKLGAASGWALRRGSGCGEHRTDMGRSGEAKGAG